MFLNINILAFSNQILLNVKCKKLIQKLVESDWFDFNFIILLILKLLDAQASI